MYIGKHVENNLIQGCELSPRGRTVLNFKIHNLSLSKSMCAVFGKTFSMTWTEKSSIECPGKLKCLPRILSSIFLLSVSSKELGFLNLTLRQNSTNVTSQHMQLKNSEDR